MTEQEYIKATNRVKVSAALTILRDVLPGDGNGVPEKEFGQLKYKLRELEERLFSSYELQESDDG